MLRIALATRPHAACLVPEKRTERTTEGGLDVARQHNLLAPVVGQLNGAGIRVSLFIAPDPQQIEAAARIGAPVIEIHTGAWCEALTQGNAAEAAVEWERIRARRAARAESGAGSPRRPRARLRNRGNDLGAARDHGAQYRPFPRGRGAVRRLRAGGRDDARGDGKGPQPRGATPHDHRHRLRRHRHPPHREGDRQATASASSRAFSPMPSARAPSGAPMRRRPTPSASPPRRPAPRRWAPACARASGGATWAW